MHPSFRAWLAGFAVLLTACGGSDSGPPQLMVYAAASLRDVAADLARTFEQKNAVPVVYNFAGSNTLAQQIRAAPGADVFLSADETWVDFVERAGRAVADTRRTFLSNRLVLIAHRDAQLGIDQPHDLPGKARFLALADPEAVPAGRYARAALEELKLGDGSTLWQRLAEHLAPTLDVRAALALVESDPEIAGIVYRTDALTSRRVQVLAELPVIEEAPIRYGAVLIDGGQATEAGRLFLDFLTSPAAQEIAERHGFSATLTPMPAPPA